MRRVAILLPALIVAVAASASFLVMSRTNAVQNPTLSLDMVINDNIYSDPGLGGDNGMTVGPIQNCVDDANTNAHPRQAYLIVQNVEDLAGVQARFNFDGTKAAVTGFNSTPFQDTSSFTNVGFLNLPIDPVLINHRAMTGASDFSVPNTALVSASYLGD